MLNIMCCPCSCLSYCFSWLIGERIEERKDKQKEIYLSPLQLKVDAYFWEQITKANSHWRGTEKKEWDLFMEETETRSEPAGTLEFIFQHHQPAKGTAIDLGCGTGSDTLFLLKRGWTVIAIDNNKKGLNILKERVMEECPEEYWKNFIPLESSMEDYKFDTKVQLINATQSLPFCDPTKFQQVWERLVNALEPEGIFNGQFYDQTSFTMKLESTMSVTEHQVKQLMEENFDECIYKVGCLDEFQLTICTAGWRKRSEQDQATLEAKKRA